ncbi:MAG: phosphatase PAP2 family protein [Prevotella sp.]|nr:phosphatase PAP2 family protein [Prevotella sp.]MBQ8712614.1 phosphatase PAP2 family protein [Prevotella sp.]
MDLTGLDKQWLLALNGSDSAFLDSLVKTLTTATTWIPLYIALIYIVIKNSDNMKRVLLIVGCAVLCVILAGSIDDLIVKPLVGRWRPTRDPEIGIGVDIVNGYRGGRFGFFSAHASNTFSIAIFLTLVIRSRLLGIALVLWSLLNCWTRVYLGVHYPGDILVGLLWGGFVGTLVWYLYTQIEKQNEHPANFISSQYTKTGYQHEHIHVAVSVLAFTLVYAIIKACFSLYI